MRPRSLTPNSVAKDRGWFTDYTPFYSFVRQIYTDGTSPVLGIGTVKITTTCAPDQNGIDSHAVMTLKHVLHVPNYVCNVIGLPQHFLEDYDLTLHPTNGSKGTVHLKDGDKVAYFDPEQRLLCPKLRGAPPGHRLGPHIWEENQFYIINTLWPDREKARYMALQAQGTLKREPGPPLNEEERAWIRRNYRNEYHLIREFGLSIYNEEHRELGRQIVRTLMHEDKDSHDDATEVNFWRI